MVPTGLLTIVTNMIWFLGDNAILDAVVAFAGADELVVSAVADATPEDVWVRQKHELPRVRRPPPVIAIVFLKDLVYDAEQTYWHVQHALPTADSKVIYLAMHDCASAIEGLDHFDAKPVLLDSLDKDHVLAKLHAA